MHENSDNVNELEPYMVKTFDALEKKKELLEMWQGVETVCKAILAKAKEDPTGVRASLLREVVQSLKSLKEFYVFAEEIDRELAEADEREEDEDGFTEQERKALDNFERMTAGNPEFKIQDDEGAA